ncbi:hypothetical protein [Streptosporangium sp. 'caverna']|uniref:hypothetical protein n=1 Tax=Streptosporangium sp. 'caverna' TaxID=2202249 RepID=UPI000D7D466F|nr:hypothetical protein [Streptosporangium sp. 'caverna']AWS46186.1 hypothetical protein DKM19_37730 [Streptosporangium sp. 'caverna']
MTDRRPELLLATGLSLIAGILVGVAVHAIYDSGSRVEAGELVHLLLELVAALAAGAAYVVLRKRSS